MQVLLAIADPSTRLLWEEVLATHGHTAVPVPPNVSGWPRVRQLRAELALIELQGDGTAGLELCRLLRTTAGGRGPSILVLVQPHQAEALVAALDAGADDVLVGRPDRQSAIGHLGAMERRYAASRTPALGVPDRGSVGPTVLLIDDQPSIRLPLRLSLEHGGYRVVEASNGPEGLALLTRYGGEISLVVVDHGMPGMLGAEVVRELRRRARQLPVVLMSGLSLADTGVEPSEVKAFLRKPFELIELARTVRRLIGEGRRATA